MFAIQAIERFQYIHSKGIIHRDIKLSNFLIGREDPENIYLIDFGFAHKFKSSRTGKHLPLLNKNMCLGSLNYKSISSNKGFEESRKDDLESFGYCLITLIRGILPWDKILSLKIPEPMKSKRISQMKESIKGKELCKGLPEEFGNYIDYCRQLTFSETPDYEKVKFFFLSILIKNRLQNDLKFSYLNKSYLEILKKKKTSVSKSNRKRSLFKKIMNNLSISKSKEKNDQSKEHLSNTTELISNKKNNIKMVLIPNKEKYNKISQLQIYNTIKPKPNNDKQNNTVNNDYIKWNTNQTFMKKKMEIFNSANSNTRINKAKVPLNIFYQNLKNQQENQRNNYLFKIPNNKIKLYIQKNYNKNNRNKMTHLYHNSNLTGETYFNNELSIKQNKVIY